MISKLKLNLGIFPSFIYTKRTWKLNFIYYLLYKGFQWFWIKIYIFCPFPFNCSLCKNMFFHILFSFSSIIPESSEEEFQQSTWKIFTYITSTLLRRDVRISRCRIYNNQPFFYNPISVFFSSFLDFNLQKTIRDYMQMFFAVYLNDAECNYNNFWSGWRWCLVFS